MPQAFMHMKECNLDLKTPYRQANRQADTQPRKCRGATCSARSLAITMLSPGTDPNAF